MTDFVYFIPYVMRKKDLFLFFIFILLYPTLGWTQLTFSGEIRPRSEYRHGFKSLASEDQDAAFFIDQRTRLNFDFKTSSTHYYLSLQDVRVWGDQSQLVTNNRTTPSLKI